MFDFFKPTSIEPKPEMPTTVLERRQPQDTATADLVRLVLGELLRRHAIPMHWIDFRVYQVPAQAHSAVHVHLIVEHWSESVWLHAGTLEAELRAGLDSFEPGTDHSGFVIAWRLPPESLRAAGGSQRAT